MAKETYQDYHYNVLKALSDGNIYTNKQIRERVIDYYNYTAEELNENLPSGKNLISDRIGWSMTYLKNAKTIENVKRGHYQITERGKRLFEQNTSITDETLKQYPEFIEYLTKSNKNKGKKSVKGTNNINSDDKGTPLEIIENNFYKINTELSSELIETIKKTSPEFFENLVIDLLLKMGYGGSREDAGEAIGRVGDEGIDGIIKEDLLGLDNIYIQAKRWNNTVQRPEIQKFVGALSGKNANKGVFITTSKFSKKAIEYAKNVNFTIILIDGNKLTNLMIEHNVGVSTQSIYEIKKVDFDYFYEN